LVAGLATHSNPFLAELVASIYPPVPANAVGANIVGAVPVYVVKMEYVVPFILKSFVLWGIATVQGVIPLDDKKTGVY